MACRDLLLAAQVRPRRGRGSTASATGEPWEIVIWFPEMGISSSWMVYFMEHPNLKWMITGVPPF